MDLIPSTGGGPEPQTPFLAAPVAPGPPPGGAVTGRAEPGRLRRPGASLGVRFRRALLGRSSWDYLKQLTGSDAYWDNMLAARRGE